MEMRIPIKKWQQLENRLADLEVQVQSQQKKQPGYTITEFSSLGQVVISFQLSSRDWKILESLSCWKEIAQHLMGV